MKNFEILHKVRGKRKNPHKYRRIDSKHYLYWCKKYYLRIFYLKKLIYKQVFSQALPNIKNAAKFEILTDL